MDFSKPGIFIQTAPVLITILHHPKNGNKTEIMNKELLLKSDLIDILFEHKNKAYGAYELRKQYNNRMQKAVAVMLGTVAVFSLLAFIPRKKTVHQAPLIYRDMRTADIKEPEKKKPEVKVEKQVKPNHPPSNALLSTIVMVDKKDPKDSIKTLNPNLAITGVTDPGEPTGVPSIVVPAGTGTADPVEPVKPVTPVVVNSGPIEDPDFMPAFPGGMDALHRFLERNLQNPQDLEQGETKSVHVRFVVGIDGKLRGFEPEGEVDKVFYQEVVRVLKKMPEWIPGKAKGENVSVYYRIPVRFVAAE